MSKTVRINVPETSSDGDQAVASDDDFAAFNPQNDTQLVRAVDNALFCANTSADGSERHSVRSCSESLPDVCTS